MTSLPRVALCTFVGIQLLLAGLATGAEDPRNVPDATPPPLGTASFIPPANIDEQPLTPQSFVVRAAIASMAEIEIGGLAQSRSGSAGVKGFGAQLVKDHGAALAKLKAIAAEAKIAMPGDLDPEHQALRNELAGLDGAAFDAKFTQAMVSGHEKAIGLFKAAADSDKLTPALRSYAQSSLPTLQQHEKLAHQLASAAQGK